MPSPVETVEAFCAMWAQPGGFAQSVRDYFTDETDYQNVGLSHTIGIDQALGMIAQFEQGMGLATIGVDMLAIVAQGDVVMTERVDHMINAAGETFTSIRLMGVFNLQDGKIVEWRDYFDASPFKS
jgi:limonene-1,2-epoxide hydrolase